MSVFFDLVLNTVCRSNHHRLAVDALAQLKGDNSARWRDLFLQQHQALLEGAKAPDTVFKDFKNHVLHVREGYWGGAPEAAEEWYKRMVRALSDKDWKYGAYCAGVMSHYIVDPLQPFHTGQTEEEGLIHRAVEWSLSKSYMELRKILLVDLGGWPDVKVDDSPNWLMKAIRAGADKSNPHYDTIIKHYNFDLGRKKPELGLDQEIKDAIAPLIGHAVVLLARVFERGFAEAKVMPPSVNLSVATLTATMNIPVASAAKAIEYSQDRAIVNSMHKEFRMTGKVRKTLPEDDKDVRALYANEVLKVPLSSLDCKWPAETGLAHGTGAPARRTKGRPKPAARVKSEKERVYKKTPAEIRDEKREVRDAEKAAARAAGRSLIGDRAAAKEAAKNAVLDRKNAALEAKQEAKAAAVAAKLAVANAARDAKTQKARAAADAKAASTTSADVKAAAAKAAAEFARKIAPKPSASGPAPSVMAVPASSAPQLESVAGGKRIRLRLEDAVSDAPSIGRKTADRLQAVAVRTVADLLKLNPEDGAKRIKAPHITAKLIKEWQAQARFACNIPDVTSINAQLLTGCGIMDLPGLANADAPKLHAEIVKYSNTEEGNRLLRSSRPPEVAIIANWVSAARNVKKAA